MKIMIITCDKCGARQEVPEDEYRRPSCITTDMQEVFEMCKRNGLDLCSDCMEYFRDHFVEPMKELSKARDEWLPKGADNG